MKERGILFRDRLVRAILRDEKTQTRRLVNPQPFIRKDGWLGFQKPFGPSRISGLAPPFEPSESPYGSPGDRLYVREAWMPLTFAERVNLQNLGMATPNWNTRVIYRADAMEPAISHLLSKGKKWKPSIHLPRVDSRLELQVRRVHVERLQDISEVDALAEGIFFTETSLGRAYDGADGSLHKTARAAFRSLWDAINGERAGASWAANPWVWAVTFARINVHVSRPEGNVAGRDKAAAQSVRTPFVSAAKVRA